MKWVGQLFENGACISIPDWRWNQGILLHVYLAHMISDGQHGMEYQQCPMSSPNLSPCQGKGMEQNLEAKLYDTNGVNTLSEDCMMWAFNAGTSGDPSRVILWNISDS